MCNMCNEELLDRIANLELKKELITRRIKNNKPLEHPILNDFLRAINKELFISEAKLKK